MKFKKTKLATAVGTAAIAMALSAPANAVDLGGDNGWDVSLTGTINLFYNHIDYSTSYYGVDNYFGADNNSSHLQEGLLPAFFTFKAKSPTVNGLTGTAQISFAPDSSSAKNTRQDKGGNAIDMREVFFNVDGSFGTISAGRTLGLFGRQAILKDMTLFGVGGVLAPDGGGTTLGRIGFGYIYPEFRTRFTYKTPSVNGFQLELGLFDPQEPLGGYSSSFETSVPMFQGEATYATTFQGGNVNFWVDGLWQEMDSQNRTGNDTVTSWGVDVGGQVAFSGFELTGNYYTGEALGMGLFSSLENGTHYAYNAAGVVGGGYVCSAIFNKCFEADNDGYYVQGTYTFNGKTKIGVSWGQSNQDGRRGVTPFTADNFRDIENTLWVVGVYHDVTPWLKLVAEYAETESVVSSQWNFNINGTSDRVTVNSDVFSIGGFIFW